MSLQSRVRQWRNRLARFVSGGYAGASHEAITAWLIGRVSQDDILKLGLAALRERSRDFCRNNGEASGFLRDMESDIVGADGVLVQSRLRFGSSGAVRETLNDTIEQEYRDWSVFGECTTDGRHSRASLARLMVRTVAQDGEFFAYVLRGEGRHGLQLQPFDPALVDDTYSRDPSPGLPGIDMGVEYDARGRVTAYHILNDLRHSFTRTRVPAESVLHIFLPLWAGQRRGVPWLAPVLLAAKINADYTEAELMQSRLGAANGVFFESEDVAIPGTVDANNKPLPIEWDATPAFGRALPPGVTVKSHMPQHPNANFVGFTASIKKEMARGVGRSYASWSGDLTQVNFSSMRVDRMRELDFNRLMQRALVLEQFERPLFRLWATTARQTGALFLPQTVTTDMVVRAARFQARGWSYIDPVKDAMAAGMLLSLGLTTRSIEAAKLGVDYYDLIEERKEEEAWAFDHGIALSNGPSSMAVAVTASADDDSTQTTEDSNARAALRVA